MKKSVVKFSLVAVCLVIIPCAGLWAQTVVGLDNWFNRETRMVNRFIIYGPTQPIVAILAGEIYLKLKVQY
ncbi:MAG: hypothetical protein HC905_29385 [Bacteroidales bacterium]|nr:hypothetical protein [Bacteroidales bacterium]